MGSLFGGDDEATTTVTETLSPEAQELIDLAFPKLEETLEKGIELFPADSVSSFSPLQLVGQAAGLQVAAEPLTDLANLALDTQSFLAGDVLFPETNPALQSSIDIALDTLVDTFNRDVLPEIRGDAVLAGGIGGSRQGVAEGIASEGLLEASALAESEILNEAYLAGLDALVKGLAFAPSTGELALLPAATIEAVGADRQALGQEKLADEEADFLFDQLIDYTLALDVLGLAGLGTGSTTTTSDLVETDTVSSILGGASLGSLLFDDDVLGATLGGITGLLF